MPPPVPVPVPEGRPKHPEHVLALIPVLAGIPQRLKEIECALGEEGVKKKPPVGLLTRMAMCAAMEADEGLQRERDSATVVPARYQ